MMATTLWPYEMSLLDYAIYTVCIYMYKKYCICSALWLQLRPVKMVTMCSYILIFLYVLCVICHNTNISVDSTNTTEILHFSIPILIKQGKLVAIEQAAL